MNKRILIVEDEWLVATDLARILEAAGCCVVAKAGSVRKALALLEAEPIDAAVIDVNLAGYSSEPLAEVLHRRGIPYVVISGYSQAQRGGLLASAPFISKPFDPDIIVDQVLRLGT